MAKVLTGTVVSTKMKNTIVVSVQRSFKHPLYEKILKSHKNFKAHVEDETKFNVGDEVTIEETRPISKDKHFKVINKREA